MAINSTYYLDAADLSLATAVYLESTLTNKAPDGFYGDGTISRQQSGGILLAAETCAACEVQVQCFEGIWEEGDPAHPTGGSVTYIDAELNTVTQDLIWLGDTVAIEYIEIISFTGVVEVDCSFLLAYKTPGANEGEISCSSIPPADNFYIYGGDLSCIIADGQIACNTPNLLDKFDGEDKYYLAVYALCDGDNFTYLIQIGTNGYITVIEQCPPTPPPP